jgi:hypothetical protein
MSNEKLADVIDFQAFKNKKLGLKPVPEFKPLQGAEYVLDTVNYFIIPGTRIIKAVKKEGSQ